MRRLASLLSIVIAVTTAGVQFALAQQDRLAEGLASDAMQAESAASCPDFLRTSHATQIADRAAERFESQRAHLDSSSVLSFLRSQLLSGLQSQLTSARDTATIRTLTDAIVTTCFPRLGAVIASLPQGSDYERFNAARQAKRDEETARQKADAEANAQRIRKQREDQAAREQSDNNERERQETLRQENAMRSAAETDRVGAQQREELEKIRQRDAKIASSFQAAAADGRRAELSMMAWFFVIIAVGIPLLYLPSIIAFRKGHPDRWAILGLNVSFGSRGWGWGSALTWAMNYETQVSERGQALAGNPKDNGQPSEQSPSTPAEVRLAEIERLAALRATGHLSDTEFGELKADVLRRIAAKTSS